MNLAVLLAVVGAASAAAAPAWGTTEDEKTIDHYNENAGPKLYKFGYNLSDGTGREEEGELKDMGTDHEALVVRGSYSFKGADGITYTVNYVADENGYHPTITQSATDDGPIVVRPIKRPRVPPKVLASLLGG